MAEALKAIRAITRPATSGLIAICTAIGLALGGIRFGWSAAAGAFLVALSFEALLYAVTLGARGALKRALAIGFLKLGVLLGLCAALVMVCRARPEGLALGLSTVLAYPLLSAWGLRRHDLTT